VSNETQKLDFYIKPLSDEAAFNKGVEYFVEMVFFYGVLISIAIWEVKKSQDASDRLKKQLIDLTKASQENEKIAKQLAQEVAMYKIERHDNMEDIRQLKESFKEIEEITKELREERDKLKGLSK